LTVKKTCLLCERVVVVHPEDEKPICPKCQPKWEAHLIVKTHMSGELDHTIPELQEEAHGTDEVDNGEAGR
jgi:hypothetical protein